MQRTLIKDTIEKAGSEVLLKGWVRLRRDHGKLIFLDFVDRSALVQVVVNPKVSEEAYKTAQKLRPEFSIEIIGKVNKRPETAVNKNILTGGVEIEAKSIKIISKAQTLPFDMGGEDLNLELPTLLDYRTLTLRHPKQKAIFKVQAEIAKSFRKTAEELGCTEIFVPTISPSATEGGSDVFKLDYYEHPAFLTQSPQLYKQMMVGVLERVYTIAHAYRAEPSVTTEHLAEVVQMDCEIAFIETFEELLDAFEYIGASIVKNTYDKCKDIITAFGVEEPKIPNKIPRLKFREAQEIIKKRTGHDLTRELDLSRADEKEIWLWARKEYNSDFVTITHYPTKKRAFYTYPDPENPNESLSYDLIFKGVEIMSGSRRINDYDQLLSVMNDRGIDTSGFGMYLQAFKYGIPPEGGFSFGLERLTMKMLNLANVREASLFPRDMERVDERFSKI
ncbi:MAG: aspartate--tRNA(Asn) ligase [Candidatus Levybacteria bacterium]|nr:aspartate--tRNA(Asn) ligase [Candidatus Levybacteria bacterium]